MKMSIVISLTVILLFALRAKRQVAEPLKLIQSITLPGLHDGSFDHFQVDLPGKRLFVAAESNSAIEVIDMGTNKLVHTISVPNTPHSMAYDTQLNKLLVA